MDAKTLKLQAKQLGFSFCGISKATELTEDAKRLELWLNQGKQGSMKYMENHFDKRIDPRKLVEGAKSVITLMYNYFPSQTQNEGIYKISKYAYGDDYHDIIKEKLHLLWNILRESHGNAVGRCFVDSAPVLERSWAWHSGAGWIGKNGNLINKQMGSFFFLAEIICDLEFEYDAPIAKDYCGSCSACIDACPTQAIEPGKSINGSKCISYFTIELKDAIPVEMKGKFQDWIFGCDICQDVCPWNRFSKAHEELAFEPKPLLLQMTKVNWNELNETIFKELFGKSAVKRTKYMGLKRNIQFLNP